MFPAKEWPRTLYVVDLGDRCFACFAQDRIAWPVPDDFFEHNALFALRSLLRRDPAPIVAVSPCPHEDLILNTPVGAVRGFAFTGYVGAVESCGGCRGSGRVMLFTSHDACSDCDGRGHRVTEAGLLPDEATLI